MGTIAARDCLRVLTLTEQVAAALIVSVRQGVALRVGMQKTSHALQQSTLQTLPGGRLAAMQQALAGDIKLVEEDRMLEPDLRVLLAHIGNRKWGLYDE